MHPSFFSIPILHFGQRFVPSSPSRYCSNRSVPLVFACHLLAVSHGAGRWRSLLEPHVHPAPVQKYSPHAPSTPSQCTSVTIPGSTLHQTVQPAHPCPSRTMPDASHLWQNSHCSILL